MTILIASTAAACLAAISPGIAFPGVSIVTPRASVACAGTSAGRLKIVETGWLPGAVMSDPEPNRPGHRDGPELHRARSPARSESPAPVAPGTKMVVTP